MLRLGLAASAVLCVWAGAASAQTASQFAPEAMPHSLAGAADASVSVWISAIAMAATTLPAGAGYTTLEIKVNYIKAMSVETGEVRCEANTIYVGGRTATAEGKILDAKGKLYAHGTTTCLIFRP